MSSVGSGLAVRTGRFQGMTEETEDSDSTENYLWLGVRVRDLPMNLDVFRAFLAPAAPRAKYGGVRHLRRLRAFKNFSGVSDLRTFGALKNFSPDEPDALGWLPSREAKVKPEIVTQQTLWEACMAAGG
jgi:hypothetical protein